MQYRVNLTIKGYIKINANSKEEARLNVEDGYLLSDVIFEDDEIDEIEEVENESITNL